MGKDSCCWNQRTKYKYDTPYIEACILLGGELTKRILLEQGVLQGNVVLPYMFILAVELLLIKINNTQLIKGINYDQKESRSETLADYTSICIKRDDEDLKVLYVSEFEIIDQTKAV